tara:strand:- start:712 stop:957 length:246 start_codon:yes stop_codon:yes gene_type:complete
MKRILIESSVVGILVVIIGTIISFIISKFIVSDLPPVCKNWNKNFIMEICLFLTGFITHLLCEYLGVNKWYCKNGNACVNN